MKKGWILLPIFAFGLSLSSRAVITSDNLPQLLPQAQTAPQLKENSLEQTSLLRSTGLHDRLPDDLIYLNDQYEFHLLAWYALHQQAIAFNDQETALTLNIAAKHNLCREALLIPPSIPCAKKQLGICADFHTQKKPYHSSCLLGLQAIAHVINEHHSTHQCIHRLSRSTSEEQFNVAAMNEDLEDTIVLHNEVPNIDDVHFYGGMSGVSKTMKYVIASCFIVLVMSLKFLGYRRFQ